MAVQRQLKQALGAINNDTRSLHSRVADLEASVKMLLEAPAKRDVETQTIESSFPVVEELQRPWARRSPYQPRQVRRVRSFSSVFIRYATRRRDVRSRRLLKARHGLTQPQI